MIAVRSTGGVRHVLVGFDLPRSNWPLDVSIIVFMQNVLDGLNLAGVGDSGLGVRPGEPVTVRAVPGALTVSIEGPLEAEVTVGPDGVATLPPLQRAGLYSVSNAITPLSAIAVNMLSDVESDLRPRRTLQVNARPAEAGAVGAAAPLELWPWLAATALGLLVLEWVVYCLKVRG